MRHLDPVTDVKLWPHSRIRYNYTSDSPTKFMPERSVLSPSKTPYMVRKEPSPPPWLAGADPMVPYPYHILHGSPIPLEPPPPDLKVRSMFKPDNRTDGPIDIVTWKSVKHVASPSHTSPSHGHATPSTPTHSAPKSPSTPLSPTNPSRSAMVTPGPSPGLSRRFTWGRYVRPHVVFVVVVVYFGSVDGVGGGRGSGFFYLISCLFGSVCLRCRQFMW
jgi:hypothetical protein